MLRKISVAIVGTMLLAGGAGAAQPTSTFPASVDDNHPDMTGGRSMPTMGGTRWATGATSSSSRVVPGPASVDDNHPDMTGGRSMPSMGR